MSQNNEYTKCDHDSLFTRGLKDGELGLNHLDSIEKLCPKTSFDLAEEHYLSGRERGLSNFCNSTRAQNRALLNLESEEVCKDFKEYVVWFEKGLDEHCSLELALKDSQSLKPSNTNCLKIKDYSKTFRAELDKLCSKKWAYQQGYKEVKLNSYCLETNQKNALILSHKLGLDNRLKQENKELKKKAAKLTSAIKVLKEVRPDTKEERRTIKVKKDKISQELLETLHSLEKNNSKL